MVAVAENGDLVVHCHELDCKLKRPTYPSARGRGPWIHAVRRTVTVPFFQGRVQRSGLVLASVPENFEMLLCPLSFRIEGCVHPVYDFLIRSTLEGDHLALVVETEVEI